MKTVREIMDPKSASVPEDMPLGRVAQELAERRINAVPVCTREGRIIGVISKTDLTQHYEGEGEGCARDAMTPEIFAIGESATMQSAIERMAFEGVHQLVVTDDQGSFIGVVTAMDVLRELAGYGRTTPPVIDPARGPSSR